MNALTAVHVPLVVLVMLSLKAMLITKSMQISAVIAVLVQQAAP
jgi:hypothetical protein